MIAFVASEHATTNDHISASTSDRNPRIDISSVIVKFVEQMINRRHIGRSFPTVQINQSRHPSAPMAARVLVPHPPPLLF
jgi:hypothetical protein